MVKRGGLFLYATAAVEGEGVEIKWLRRPMTVTSLNPKEAVEKIGGSGFEVVKGEVTEYNPVRAPNVGLRKHEEVLEEPLLWVYVKKPALGA